MTGAAIPETERLCAVGDVPDEGALGLDASIDGQVEALLLLRRGEEVRAFHNVCPHAGRRLDWAPNRFITNECTVICAAHGATFRVPDGLCTAGPCRGQSLREVPLRLDGGAVYLALRTPG